MCFALEPYPGGKDRVSTTKVRIITSHPVLTAQYTRALESDTSIQLVSEREPFDIGVFDGGLPSLDAALHVARVRLPFMRPVLLWSCCDENSCLQWVLRGVWGVVAYDRYETDLSNAVRYVAAGQLWVPPLVVIRWMQIERTGRSAGSQVALTDREREVLQLLERRLSNKEIAGILRISERTAKFHVGNILSKLHLRSRQDLFAA